jgi:hypothetical protein
MLLWWITSRLATEALGPDGQSTLSGLIRYRLQWRLIGHMRALVEAKKFVASIER